MASVSDNNGHGRHLRPGKLPGPLLDHLIERYRTRPDPDVLVTPGYGRDAAAIGTGGPDPVVVKSDPITFATESAAHYLVAVNANDIACMGGVPRWFSVVLLMPEQSTASQVESLFAELQEACDQAAVSIVGGHTEVTDAVTRPVFIGTMLGVAGQRGLLRPGEARTGDELLLTKWAGIEGTALIARERGPELARALGEDLVLRAARLLRTPGISVVRDAATVRSVEGVTALHDPTEGGVATAIHELAAASRCGAEVLQDAIPFMPETAAICDHYGIDPLGLIGSGALLVAVDPRRRAAVTAAADASAVPITRIGRLVPLADGVTMIGPDGRVPLPRFDADEVTRVL